MRIIYHNEGEDPALWLHRLHAALPEADIRPWPDGRNESADYALVWQPPTEMLAGRTELKAIFNLAAGVDWLLKMDDALPQNVPIYRLEDAGMAVQLAEYVVHAVLRRFRRFEEYEAQARRGEWAYLDPYDKSGFTVGILGMGVMGRRIAEALAHFGFPLRGWSRSEKHVPGVACFAGDAGFDAFLQDLSVLICVLPLTDGTRDILNAGCFARLKPGALLVNLGRGEHLVESDLLAALASGQITAATLDVVRAEPLPADHPFWREPRITLTPHMAGLTFADETVQQVAARIRALENGQPVTGLVDRNRGY